MLRIVISSACCVAIVSSLAGCQQDPASESAPPVVSPVESESHSPDDSPTTTAPGSDTTAPVEKVEITIATFDELQASIAESKGKVVVVDYWSTSCPPCLAEFPGLVAIHNELPHDQVRCVSASLDYEGLADFPVEEARKLALEFLEQQKATLDNFILSEDSLTVMDDKLKIASIPAVFVFGVDGKLARMFDESSGESFTYEKDVTPFVKELVAQSFSAETGSTNE
ncbi:MAG: TlpA disulfide reductase family protein [Planctomycetota bacterium]|nr:TlpA disulfide reductase family protein [Planctomycetota bacterium]MDA0920610.1 TlpA disulfide reductase family protein [Planctomycetota bacterium]MDA1159321.1 TlpA disulfide reductase family protein [Planctomycetota bacterium]